MRPIPLAAPDGRIYSYACGVCNQVAHVGELLTELDGPDPELVADTLVNAVQCCTCTGCRAPIGKRLASCNACTALSVHARATRDAVDACRHGTLSFDDCDECEIEAAEARGREQAAKVNVYDEWAMVLVSICFVVVGCALGPAQYGSDSTHALFAGILIGNGGANFVRAIAALARR